MLMFCGILLLVLIGGFSIFLIYLNIPVKPKSKVCLVGKTAIITGANRGIGYEVALSLAQRGCKVIIACRTNLEETRNKIIQETLNTNIVAKYIDLSSFESVRSFANEINKTEDRLDILISNALGGESHTHTKDGLHPAMQIGHFSPFLLVHLLADLLKQSAPSRIIFVTSLMCYLSRLTVDKLNYPDVPLHITNILAVYNNVKLCNVALAECFAKRLKASGVTSNAVHPGLTNTSVYDHFMNAGTNNTGIVSLVRNLLLRPFAKTPEEGAYAIVEYASSNAHKNVTGKLVYDRGVVLKPYQMWSSEFSESIWKETEKYVDLQENEKL